MTAAPYVALGDSYAAGVGGGPPRDICWRATAGYPVQVAHALGVDLAYQSCISAKVADVEATQLAPLGPATRYVSLTVGGNDGDFVQVIVRTAEPGWLGSSDPMMDHAARLIRDVIPGRLRGLYAQVRARAPHAIVVVAGYPLLFDGVDCEAGTFFTTHEMTRLNDLGDQLNAVIASEAGRAGFTFVDPRPAFRGHAICDRPEWLNGLALPLQGSFHPNRLGHDAYAALVTQAFRAHEPGLLPDRVGAQTEPQVVHGPPIPGSAPTFSFTDWITLRSHRPSPETPAPHS